MKIDEVFLGKVRKVMKIDEDNFRKSEESYEDRWGFLLGKVRKAMKIYEENFRKSELSYEDRWGKF